MELTKSNLSYLAVILVIIGTALRIYLDFNKIQAQQAGRQSGGCNCQ